MSRLTEAADAFAVAWSDPLLAESVGPKLTCEELDALVELFRSDDREDVAVTWIIGHGLSDEEPTDDHHALITTNNTKATTHGSHEDGRHDRRAHR